MDARRGATKNSSNFTSVLDRWQNDEIYRASQLVHGRTEEYVNYRDYISQMGNSYESPYKQSNRHESTLFMRGVDSNKQAGPLCQRPDYKSSANALASIQREQVKGVRHISMYLRTRQRDTLDPAVQQHSEWLSFNWMTYFSSSSSSTWTGSPTWWSSSSWDIKGKKWPSQGWQDLEWAGSAITPTTRESRTDLYNETCTEASERKDLNCCQVHVNPDSIRSLAHFSDFVAFSCSFASRTVATGMNATGGVRITPHPYAHTRTFPRCARLRTPDVITRLDQGLDDLFVCVSKSNFATGHVIAECSFGPVSTYFLITYCLTETTYCVPYAIDWNQTKPLCNSARGWNVWSSGRLDPKHRTRAVDIDHAKTANTDTCSRRLGATHRDSRDDDSEGFRTSSICQNGGECVILHHQWICYGRKQFYSFMQRRSRTKKFSRTR